MYGYMKCNALIPVKSLSIAKSRLTPSLTQHQREKLVLDMFHHVLRVLFASEVFDKVSVVSSDQQILENAYLWGAKPILEEYHDHNQALHSAALSELSEGATKLLTISADLPLLTTQEVRYFYSQSLLYDLVLAPSREGTGTNAILVQPPLAVPYVFGLGSLQSFVNAAKEKHLNYTIYHSIGLALDIDTIDDLNDAEALNNKRKEIIYRS
ncbi:MAG TPA: 2-phospho-L-lactate guanylyltransferase [Ktedonobacteraceae bacterium]|nr:2-phospho-L-lactate guanylyltransferase [Ktedonobacteraceae bacterium]